MLTFGKHGIIHVAARAQTRHTFRVRIEVLKLFLRAFRISHHQKTVCPTTHRMYVGCQINKKLLMRERKRMMDPHQHQTEFADEHS